MDVSRGLEIGELQRIPIRQYWDYEDRDFTPWLAENLSYLEADDILGMRLKVQDTEASVGGYYADIHATDIDGERDVIIENQYGNTDHRHLGQSIAYAGGFEADVVVWIAETFDDAHIDAVQWFNERTDEETAFFAVKVELLRIEDSPVAPRFTVVERPSRWKAVTGELSETEREHVRFWNAFEQRLDERGLSEYNQDKTLTSASYAIGIDSENAYTRQSSTIYDDLRCVLRIEDETGNLGGLDKDGVEAALRTTIANLNTRELTPGAVDTIDWVSRPDHLYDKVVIHYEGDVDRSNEEEWQTYHDWLIDATLAFDDVFSERL